MFQVVESGQFGCSAPHVIFRCFFFFFFVIHVKFKIIDGVVIREFIGARGFYAVTIGTKAHIRVTQKSTIDSGTTAHVFLVFCELEFIPRGFLRGHENELSL